MVSTFLPIRRPNTVSVIPITSAISKPCFAALSAFSLFLSPIALAIVAVIPVPRPKVIPITKKYRGMLKATAAIESPPNCPMNSMSTME